MSLLNVWLTPAEATVAVDTDALAEDGTHVQMSKIFALAHLNAVFAARGESVFQDVLATQCQVLKPQSFDDLVDMLPEVIAAVERIAMPISGSFPEGIENRGNEIVFVGWSLKRSRMMASLCRKVSGMADWQHAEIKYFHAPPASVATDLGIPNSPKSIERFTTAQAQYMARTSGYGGGTLIVCRLTKETLSLAHALKFSDQPLAALAA